MDESKNTLSTPAIIAIALAVVAVPCCLLLVIFGALLIFSGAGIGPIIYQLF